MWLDVLCLWYPVMTSVTVAPEISWRLLTTGSKLQLFCFVETQVCQYVRPSEDKFGKWRGSIALCRYAPAVRTSSQCMLCMLFASNVQCCIKVFCGVSTEFCQLQELRSSLQLVELLQECLNQKQQKTPVTENLQIGQIGGTICGKIG